jgi:hypothetical protein
VVYFIFVDISHKASENWHNEVAQFIHNACIKFSRDDVTYKSRTWYAILVKVELFGSVNIRSELPLSPGRPSCKGFHQHRDHDSRGSIEAPP